MSISKHAAARSYVKVLAETKIAAIDPSTLEAAGRVMQHASWAIPLASATATGIATIAERMTAASRKAQVYKTMMESNPHLHEQDPTLVQKYFNVLYTMNPEFAKEPTIAGSFVMNQVSVGSNPVAPHVGVFDAALKMRGGGGGMNQQQRPGSMGQDLGAFAKAVGGMDDREKKIRELVQQQRQGITDFETGQREKERGDNDRLRTRQYSMGKKREQGANQKLDQMQKSMQGLSSDAARFQSLLDAHGIQY